MSGRRPSTASAPPERTMLDAASELTDTIMRAEAARFSLAADWAEAHPAPVEDAVVDAHGDLVMYGDRPITLAGEGAPGMSEFAIAEFAAAVGVSTHAGRALIAAAIECKHRLPGIWAQTMSARVPVWKVRRVTEQTHRLTMAGAAYVDRALAPVIGACTWTQVETAVSAAAAVSELEKFEIDVADRSNHRHFDVLLDAARLNDGLVPVAGLLDYADALALDAAISERAHALLSDHPELDLDLRRAIAAGALADEATGTGGTGGARELVVYAHHDPADPNGVALVEGVGAMPVDQLYTWCVREGVHVSIRPVLELDAEVRVDRYEPTAAQREQAILTCPTCIFPGCGRSARRCDLDHVVAYSDGGETTSWNLAPLCRLHHRLKTHGRWSYRRLTRTSFEWTSACGYTHLVDLTQKRRHLR